MNMRNITFFGHTKAAGFYAVTLLILTAVFGTSCKKESLMELNKGEAPLGLSVNKDNLILMQKQESADAVVFTWTSGSNRGTNSSIAYTLQIDKQGNNFANAISEELGKAAFTKKYSVKELNTLLLSHWNAVPGQETILEARVISNVSGNPDFSETADTVIKVTPYQPVTETLYLIGDAAPNGWSADNATALTRSNEVPGEFNWEGTLNGGELKFITALGQFTPSYNKGANDQTLVYRKDDNDPADNKFTVATPGRYRISVNLLDLSISVSEAAGAPFERLWVLGDAMPKGWDINNPDEMRVDPTNPFVFRFTGVLKSGEFKIPTTTGDFNTAYYMPLTNHPDITATDVQLMPAGGNDLKWMITTPGAYKIKLDLEAMKIDIKPFTPYAQIWMVGDATPAGWNIDNPTPLTPDAGDPNVFTYTGAMKVGEFKFPVFTGNGWQGDFFMPEVNGAGPESTRMRFVPNGNPDFKWKITQAGNYKITINQLYETISIEKL